MTLIKAWVVKLEHLPEKIWGKWETLPSREKFGVQPPSESKNLEPEGWLKRISEGTWNRY